MTFAYSKANRLSDYGVEDLEKGVQMKCALAYDEFGRESERVVRRGEKTLLSLSQTYGNTGLITTRVLKDKQGVILLSENFAYDNQNRLSEYECGGTQAPVDEKGNRLLKQSFSFGNFGNIVERTTVFQDQSRNITRYTYSQNDPTQLVQITNTNGAYRANIVLEYDANDCLTKDEEGRELEYNTLGQLIAVRGTDGKILCEYRYDASGKLACQIGSDQQTTYLLYREDTLIATKTDERRVSYVSDGESYWGQVVQDGRTEQLQNQLWVSDGHESVLAWLDSRNPEELHLQTIIPMDLERNHPSLSKGSGKTQLPDGITWGTDAESIIQL